MDGSETYAASKLPDFGDMGEFDSKSDHLALAESSRPGLKRQIIVG
jgi:hypothetical protein